MFAAPALKDSPLKTPRGQPEPSLLPMLQGPLLKLPYADIFGVLATQQLDTSFCGNLEMTMLNCIDQYGYNRGTKMCGGYIQDVKECRYRYMQTMRQNIMEEERKRQYRDGKIKNQFEELPAYD